MLYDHWISCVTNIYNILCTILYAVVISQLIFGKSGQMLP